MKWDIRSEKMRKDVMGWGKMRWYSTIIDEIVAIYGNEIGWDKIRWDFRGRGKIRKYKMTK